MADYHYLDGVHDLSLPDWGPYSKKYFGISHLADRARGMRFDFTVMPGVYRRQLGIPDVLRPPATCRGVSRPTFRTTPTASSSKRKTASMRISPSPGGRNTCGWSAAAA